MKLNELYLGCRTYRRFLQDPMPEEAVDEILENFRICNCGRNGQSLKAYAVLSEDKVRAMQPLVRWAASLPPEIGTPKEGEQPVAFFVLTRPEQYYPFTGEDVGIAAHVITTTAWAYGFGSCMMGNISIRKIKELLEIPEGEEPRLVIAVGKPAHTSTLVEVTENGKLDYYVDEDRNYYVPKKKLEEVACKK